MSRLSRLKTEDWYKIIICDEKWTLYNNPKRRKSWDYTGETSTTDAKPNIHGKKVFLPIWWDQQVVICSEQLSPRETVTAERYQKQLIRFRNVLNGKHPYTGEGKREVILLHDNIWPRTPQIILKTITDLDCEILFQLPYSPDLAPSYYHLVRIFRTLQRQLADTHFNFMEEVKKSIHDFIDSNQSIFFRREFQQRTERETNVQKARGIFRKLILLINH